MHKNPNSWDQMVGFYLISNVEEEDEFDSLAHMEKRKEARRQRMLLRLQKIKQDEDEKALLRVPAPKKKETKQASPQTNSPSAGV